MPIMPNGGTWSRNSGCDDGWRLEIGIKIGIGGVRGG